MTEISPKQIWFQHVIETLPENERTAFESCTDATRKTTFSHITTRILTGFEAALVLDDFIRADERAKLIVLLRESGYADAAESVIEKIKSQLEGNHDRTGAESKTKENDGVSVGKVHPVSGAI